MVTLRPSRGMPIGVVATQYPSTMKPATRSATAYVLHRSRPLPCMVIRPASAASLMYPKARRGAAKMRYSSNVVQYSQSWMTVWPNLREHGI